MPSSSNLMKKNNPNGAVSHEWQDGQPVYKLHFRGPPVSSNCWQPGSVCLMMVCPHQMEELQFKIKAGIHSRQQRVESSTDDGPSEILPITYSQEGFVLLRSLPAAAPIPAAYADLLKTPDASPSQTTSFVKSSSPKLHTDFTTWPPQGCLSTRGLGQHRGWCPGSAWERLWHNIWAYPWPGHLHKLLSYRAQATASRGEMQVRGTKSNIKMFCRTQG